MSANPQLTPRVTFNIPPFKPPEEPLPMTVFTPETKRAIHPAQLALYAAAVAAAALATVTLAGFFLGLPLI